MLRRVLLIALGCWLPAGASHGAERVLTVFAAASLTDVLDKVGKVFTADAQIQVRFSFAASSALARQIESGAPADAFVSADQEWMNYLQARNLIAPATRSDIVSNSLVLVAPVDSAVQLRIEPGFALAAALGDKGRLATGDPASVPVGRYARAALQRLGVWSSIESRLIPADNVRTALNFVSRGEAPLGIVYETDAKAEPAVKVVDVFPADSHLPIVYPAALTAHGTSAQAKAFLDYTKGAKAAAVFRKYGFIVLP